MMNHKIFLPFILCTLLLINACKKSEISREDLMDAFISSSKSTKNIVQDSVFSLKNAEKSGPSELILTFNSTLSSDEIRPSLIKLAIKDLMINMIKKNPKNMQLLDKGVNFRMHILDKNGKPLAEDLINKNSMYAKNPDDHFNEKHNEINQFLEISNSKLPIVDSVSGVKIVKIALGSQDDVIYTAEVPEHLKSLLTLQENKDIIRQNMLKDEQFKNMISELKNYDIFSIKYQYRDKKGKLLQEVEMREKDFR